MHHNGHEMHVVPLTLHQTNPILDFTQILSAFNPVSVVSFSQLAGGFGGIDFVKLTRGCCSWGNSCPPSARHDTRHVRSSWFFDAQIGDVTCDFNQKNFAFMPVVVQIHLMKTSHIHILPSAQM